MIKIEITETYGWEAAIRGMRNPMNSWDKSDSKWDGFGDADGFSVGENDYTLMMKLRNAGSDHRKFMRMIMVSVDITAPLYWWKEYDTYKIATVANSCSTMHKIHSKRIELSDFSIDNFAIEYSDIGLSLKDMFLEIVADCELLRQRYITTGDKRYWKGLIQLLPEGYNQKRTLTLNYEVLLNMYHSRKAHKLNEWREFCKWIEELPYSELITGTRDENGKEKQGAALS
jgi:hypothetical protein